MTAASASASINSYEITDTNSALLPSASQIDANRNNGNFQVAFDITASGSVDVELSVTENEFGGFQCGDETTEFLTATVDRAI